MIATDIEWLVIASASVCLRKNQPKILSESPRAVGGYLGKKRKLPSTPAPFTACQAASNFVSSCHTIGQRVFQLLRIQSLA